jgi:hypothetical protein
MQPIKMRNLQREVKAASGASAIFLNYADEGFCEPLKTEAFPLSLFSLKIQKPLRPGWD